MRSELGKITLDKTFEERDTLNVNIVEAINVAATDWGLKCLSYEIRDISPPLGVRAAMEMQAEGERQAHINIADGKKNSVILQSEAAKMDQVNRALEEAEAIVARAEAAAKGISLVSQTLKENGGIEAASLKIAEQYVHAFGNIAKEGTTLLLPSSASDPASMISEAHVVYKSLLGNVSVDLTRQLSPNSQKTDDTEGNQESKSTKKTTLQASSGKVMLDLKMHYRPESLNYLDEILVFESGVLMHGEGSDFGEVMNKIGARPLTSIWGAECLLGGLMENTTMPRGEPSINILIDTIGLFATEDDGQSSSNKRNEQFAVFS
uniref:Uncharacterized protein n=1 Tax=Kalanchoe fedtschenkoi TaxID=63787 RepID=A0A7N0VL74_KALFE